MTIDGKVFLHRAVFAATFLYAANFFELVGSINEAVKLRREEHKAMYASCQSVLDSQLLHSSIVFRTVHLL